VKVVEEHLTVDTVREEIGAAARDARFVGGLPFALTIAAIERAFRQRAFPAWAIARTSRARVLR
jgi:hypothetical protein